MDRININNVEYYRLYCKCPVCLSKGINTEPVYWQHKICGGNIFVGSDAYLLCERDNYRSSIVCWDFLCPQHCISSGFYVEGSRDFYRNEHLDYFNMFVDMIHTTGLNWFSEFMINLVRQLPEESK